MTVPILCQGKLILYTQNRLFDILHNAITYYIEKNDVQISHNIQALLEKTDQGVYGAGGVIADIANYLKTKEEALFFAELVRIAIEKEKEEFARIVTCLQNMQNFHQEILKYAQELP